MRFNAAKCNIMRMSRKQTPISTQYELSGQVLEEVKDAKYLGVTVSDNLEWTKHINAITTKANSKLSFLRRNLKGCPEKLRETAYFALVRSFLEHSATVWHPHQKYNSDKLEMVQRRAARFVKGRYGMYESVTQMLGFHYRKDVKTLVSFFSTKLSTIWPWCPILNRVGKKPGFFVINRKNPFFWFKPGFFGFYGFNGFFSVCTFL